MGVTRERSETVFKAFWMSGCGVTALLILAIIFNLIKDAL